MAEEDANMLLLCFKCLTRLMEYGRDLVDTGVQEENIIRKEVLKKNLQVRIEQLQEH